MANVIKELPLTTAGDPEILPWATGGTTLEPTAGQESTGWQPQAVAGPPDYRLENYARLKQSQLNARGVQTGLFLECAAASVRLSGFAAGVNQRRITINGTNFDVTDATSLAAVRDAFVAAINSHAPTAALVTASSAGSVGPAEFLAIVDNTPGAVYSAAPSLAVSVLAGAGTITVPSPASTPIVREDAAGMAADMVIGGLTADDDGDVAHDARIVWRKAKGSFRAGTFTGTQADNANTGLNSIGLGSNCIASGSDSVALGPASTASAVNTLAALGATVAGTRAIGLGSSASVTAAGTNGIAIGNAAASSAASAVAIGDTATSSGANAIAIGSSTSASGSASLAMVGGSATAANAIAIGATTSATAATSLAMLGATASAANAIAIGSGATASGIRGSFASGQALGTVSATGEGARAHGFTAAGSTIDASGKGAVAVGHTGTSIATITATGNGAMAVGYNVNATANSPLTASGANSQAFGSGSLASGDYSQAVGYGAKATNRGEAAQASVAFDGPLFTMQPGSCQKGSLHFALRTTDATADQNMTPGPGVGTAFTPLADTVYICDASVIAKKEATDDAYASWSFKFTLAYVAGVLTVKRILACDATAPAWVQILAGNAITHFDDGAAAGAAWLLKVDANAGAVRFRVTGAALTNIRWSARCDYVAVGQQP